MNFMFDECNNLEKIIINILIFKTNNINKNWLIFSECCSVKEINLSRSKNNKEVNMTHMFECWSNLRKINRFF